MDINQSPLPGYKPDNHGITGSAQDAKAATEVSKAKNSSDSGSQSTPLQGLKEGQVIRGQVIDHRYNEITIQLKPSDQTITARLNGNIPLSIGQEAVFFVSDNSGDSLVLKCLPQDLTAATDLMIQKALSASGFGMSEKNRQIVQELLNHNMPIDKQTLQTLIKLSHKNPSASPLTLVLMYKNHIPMTPENIRQFEAYQNGTNRLINNIRSISSGITKLITQTGENNPEGEQTTAHNSSLAPDKTTITLPPSRDSIKMGPTDGQSQYPTADFTKEEFTSLESIPLNELPSAEGLNRQLTRLLEFNDRLLDLLSTSNPSELSDSAAPLNNPSTLASFLTPGELNSLLGAMKDFNLPDQMKSQIKDGSASIGQLLDFIRQSLGTLNEESAAKFLASPEYGKLLENALLQRWTVSPEQLSEKDPVTELYHNLKEDMDRITRLIKDNSGNAQAEQMKEPLKDTQQNLQFMKDLNDAFTYLQLPVQLRDRELHSELYVLNHKKAHQDTPGNISVLLHLDMEHLGPMNVNLTMHGNSIRAQFHLSGDNALQLIKTNLPLLSDALIKKGYTLNGEVAADYKKPDFSRDFIEEGSGDGKIRSYTFDIRT